MLKDFKLLIAIMGCHRREDRTDIQRATWMRGGPFDPRVTVRIFRGHDPGGISATNHGNEIWLNCPDTYEGMCEKARMVYAHAYLNRYDFTLTTGDDTWVHVPRLVSYCESIWQEGKPLYDYVGHLRGCDGQYDDDYASGGPGTLLSEKALSILTSAPATDDPAEDRWASNTLRAAGILLHSDRRHFCLPAEWRDRHPWEPVTVETMRVHRGEVASMAEIHEECYEAVATG